MVQNRSSAVMQQRSEPHDSLDDFPTPPWATRAVVEWLDGQNIISPNMTVREPCANRGYMVRPLLEYFSDVEAGDVHDYGMGYQVIDYLWGADPEPVDCTFQNPPFKLAQQFIERALRTSRKAVVVIVRSAFTEGISRYEQLFADTPPHFVLQHVERVPMCKGRYDPEIASATAYAWLAWLPGQEADTRYRWIAPCRRRLERSDDVLTFDTVAA